MNGFKFNGKTFKERKLNRILKRLANSVPHTEKNDDYREQLRDARDRMIFLIEREMFGHWDPDKVKL